MSAGPDPQQWEQDDAADPGLDIEVLRRRRDRVLTLLALAFVLGVALFVSRGLFRSQPVERTELIAAAKQAVREAAPPNVALEFSTATEFVIEMESEDRYSVTGEVVLIPTSGHSSRFFFECALSRNEQGPWRPVRLSVTPG